MAKAEELLLLDSYSDGFIDDAEFALLFSISNTSKEKYNPSFQYWNYKFDLDGMNDDECNAEFRFKKSDIYRLCSVFKLKDVIVTKDRHVVPSVEAVCILLKRLAYPCRLGDMIPRFGRPVPTLSIIFKHMIDLIYEQFHHLLKSFDQPLLQKEKLIEYAASIYKKSNAIKNCWGFIDGTVRDCCRPGKLQRTCYNGHHRTHALKFQSVTCPNGMIANLFGPVEGKRHDASIFAQSNLLRQLQAHSFDTDQKPLCIYGDPAYPIKVHLMTGFKGSSLTDQQKEFNKRMSSCRVTVEWIFGDIIRNFAFTDFKQNLKLHLSPIGKMYIVAALLTNAHTCLYGNNTSRYFDASPPVLEDYFQVL